MLNVGGIFPPWRHLLSLSSDTFSNYLLRKISWAGGNSISYSQAQKALAELADLEIDAKAIARITDTIGQELLLSRNRTDFMQLPEIPATSPAAVISTDGGRVQVREENQSPGVHNPKWKEPLVAHFQLMETENHNQDPHPEVPECFINQNHVRALVKELGGFVKKTHDNKEKTEPWQEETKKSEQKDNILLKSCLASMLKADGFAPLVRNEAQNLGLENAQKKVFIADGGTSNWLIYEKFFNHWPALLDFTHLVEHLFLVASSIFKKPDEAWQCYKNIVTLAWQGKPESILTFLKEKQKEIGLPPKKAKESDPKCVLHRAIHYIRENQNRMDYPTMRKRGLPISSCRVESLIKQVNQRIKASDKFWVISKLEAILQIRAAELSTTQRWNVFWGKRHQLLIENNVVFMNRAA